MRLVCRVGIGGARGNRTPDLLHAMQALSHLSYGPYLGVASGVATPRIYGRDGPSSSGKLA